jgi:hypothetical protein
MLEQRVSRIEHFRWTLEEVNREAERKEGASGITSGAHRNSGLGRRAGPAGKYIHVFSCESLLEARRGGWGSRNAPYPHLTCLAGMPTASTHPLTPIHLWGVRPARRMHAACALQRAARRPRLLQAPFRHHGAGSRHLRKRVAAHRNAARIVARGEHFSRISPKSVHLHAASPCVQKCTHTGSQGAGLDFMVAKGRAYRQGAQKDGR